MGGEAAPYAKRSGEALGDGLCGRGRPGRSVRTPRHSAGAQRSSPDRGAAGGFRIENRPQVSRTPVTFRVFRLRTRTTITGQNRRVPRDRVSEPSIPRSLPISTHSVAPIPFSRGLPGNDSALWFLQSAEFLNLEPRVGRHAGVPRFYFNQSTYTTYTTLHFIN